MEKQSIMGIFLNIILTELIKASSKSIVILTKFILYVFDSVIIS